MTPINPASIAIGRSAIGNIEGLLSSLNAAGPRTSLPPAVRQDLLGRAEAVLREDALTPAQAALVPLDRMAYGYLFRFPGDSDLFSRLIVPSSRTSLSSLDLGTAVGFPLPPVIAFYRTVPELDRPLLSFFLQLSSVFRSTRAGAYGEAQDIKPDNASHQAIMALLGAVATLTSLPAPEEKNPPSKKRGPKAEKAI